MTISISDTTQHNHYSAYIMPNQSPFSIIAHVKKTIRTLKSLGFLQSTTIPLKNTAHLQIIWSKIIEDGLIFEDILIHSHSGKGVKTNFSKASG